MPFCLTAFEGSVISVLVRIAFEGAVGVTLLNYVSGFLAVTPALANITSFIWVRIGHGRDKIRFIRTLQLVVIGLVGVMGFVPLSEVGLVGLSAGVFLARTCWSGISTIRSTVWHANYPQGTRARVTGKFAIVQVALIAFLSWGLGQAMDRNANAFRLMFPVGALLGFVAFLLWGGIRVRGQAALIKRETEGDVRDMPSFNPASLARVLIDDHAYARYMFCQFLLGMGNITAMVVLPVMMRERFDADYSQALWITSSISLATMPLAIPLWARFLDHTHIVHFRAVHSWVFVGALGMLSLAAWTGRYEWLYVFAVLKGIGFGGGVLGWTLGHLDFAPAGKESQYMGVHVTLTGVRGVLAWIGGMWLYGVFADPARPELSAVTPMICLVVTTLGAIGFVVMSRGYRAPPSTRPAGAPEPAPPVRASE